MPFLTPNQNGQSTEDNKMPTNFIMLTEKSIQCASDGNQLSVIMTSETVNT